MFKKTSPSAPQGSQCKILHILASVGDCNMILHTYCTWFLKLSGEKLLIFSSDIGGSTSSGFKFFNKFC